ncbi:unnamed protein product, partial [marine sediment metagenome]
MNNSKDVKSRVESVLLNQFTAFADRAEKLFTYMKSAEDLLFTADDCL